MIRCAAKKKAKKAKKTLDEKILLVISYFIKISLVIAIISAAFSRSWSVVFVSSLSLFLTFLPAIFERNYKIHLPAELEIIVVVFIYAALFLGEVHQYYTRYWWWDVVMHTGSGIVLGFAGFIIVFILYHEQKVRTSPLFIAVFSFCFAVSIGVLWEIVEFSIDMLCNTNMQKSGIVDTMWDLIVDSAGALITSIMGFFYIKCGRAPIFKGFLRRFIKENPKLFIPRK
ncbi:hypothetical protein JXB31_03870 [Candidatus Woesearchaeota archaeon]|nr:hypothetical protein [Candidatus Woesearchaeota archaeon]